MRLSLVFAGLLLATTANAQLFRAYLAPSGSDANPCTLPAPCRLLPAALAAVANEGEIWMLDSANYNTGPVSITKSVTILAVPGSVGSVVATGGNAIDITHPSAKVTLRNLVIVPVPGGGGVNGVSMTAGLALTIENCLIANLPGVGVFASTSAAFGPIVRVTDTTIRDNGDHGVLVRNVARATITRAILSGNGGAGGSGLRVEGTTAGTTTRADIGDSTLDGNGDGLYAWSSNASAPIQVSVHGSRIVRNVNLGAFAYSTAGASVALSVSNSIVSNNGDGVATIGSGSKAWASGNTVSNNFTGFLNPSGTFESAGNNALRNNAYNTSGTITMVSTQ